MGLCVPVPMIEIGLLKVNDSNKRLIDFLRVHIEIKHLFLAITIIKYGNIVAA